MAVRKTPPNLRLEPTPPSAARLSRNSLASARETRYKCSIEVQWLGEDAYEMAR